MKFVAWIAYMYHEIHVPTRVSRSITHDNFNAARDCYLKLSEKLIR